MTTPRNPDLDESPYTPARFQEWLRSKAAGYCADNPSLDSTRYREIEVHPDEARFLRAVEAGIVVVDEVGRCRLQP